MTEFRRARSVLDRALVAGALTTIATGGALIGLGLRDGDASRVYRLVGQGLLERAGVLSVDAPLSSVALGYAHHLTVAFLWGTMLGALVLIPRSGMSRVVAALVAASLYGTLSLAVIPPLFRIGYAVTSNAVTVVPIAVAMLFAMAGDVWIESAETP